MTSEFLVPQVGVPSLLRMCSSFFLFFPLSFLGHDAKETVLGKIFILLIVLSGRSLCFILFPIFFLFFPLFL